MKKIFITTLTMFIILTVFTIPISSQKDKKVLRTNLEISDITGLKTTTIYLLNQQNYLVQTEIFMDTSSIEDKVEEIIHYLVVDSDKIPIGLNGYIPSHVKLLDYSLENEQLFLDFSKEFLDGEMDDKAITGIVYSFLNQEKIEAVSFSVEGRAIEKYQYLTKEMGINKEYFLSSRSDIQKVVIYYLDNSSTYYVPVTKYLNDGREKIEIIVEELQKTHKDLVSLENVHTKLLDYKEEENVFFLNFNEYLLDENVEASEKLLNSIAYSVFDNYDVRMVSFEVNGKSIKYINRK